MKKINLTIDAIVEKTFKKSFFRGLKRSKVDDFLNLVIDDYASFEEEIKELKIKNEELRTENFKIKMNVLKTASSTMDVNEMNDAKTITLNDDDKFSRLEKQMLKLQKDINAMKKQK